MTTRNPPHVSQSVIRNQIAIDLTAEDSEDDNAEVDELDYANDGQAGNENEDKGDNDDETKGGDDAEDEAGIQLGKPVAELVVLAHGHDVALEPAVEQNISSRTPPQTFAALPNISPSKDDIDAIAAGIKRGGSTTDVDHQRGQIFN